MSARTNFPLPGEPVDQVVPVLTVGCSCSCHAALDWPAPYPWRRMSTSAACSHCLALPDATNAVV